MRVNHYHWLEKHFQTFLENLGIEGDYRGLIGAHGDKCYGFQHVFEEHGVEFSHGVAIYLLTHMGPFSEEVRQRPDGSFVRFPDWFVREKDRFLKHLPAVDLSDPDILSRF